MRFLDAAPLLAIDLRRIEAVKIGGNVAMAVAPKEPHGMEARIARLESDMAHVRSDIAEIKTDLRSLRDRIDRLVESLAAAKIWALVLYVALAGARFGPLARGVGWI